MDKKSKNNPNLIEPIANKFKEIIVPTLPSFITTYNLTLISLIWSSSILYAGYKSQKNIKWLYLVILSIIFHWITDTLDGAVGRYRNTGAIKWGYYMDHTMDIILTSSVFISLIIALPTLRLPLFIIYSLIVQMFMTSFLTIDNNGLDVSSCISQFCIGPADGLFILIGLIYHIIVTNGKPNIYLLYTITGILVFLNIIKIYQKQNKLHKEDMLKKNNK
jgi:hypothetical protein